MISRKSTKGKKLGIYVETEEELKKFHDWCEQYQFDFFADNEDFNDRFNRPEMWRFLAMDRTEDLFYDLYKQIQINSNFVLFIFGPRDMGKSEVGGKILLEYKKMFLQARAREIEHHIGFSNADMSDIFAKMNPGDIALRDESPYLSGEGSTTVKRNLNNIVNITRAYQVSFIFVNPQLIEEVGVDYYIEVAGKDYENRTIRCILYDRRMMIIGVIFIKLHDDEDFRKEYKRMKMENIKSLMALSGGTYAGIDTEKLEGDAIKLYEFCLERDVDTKIKIKTQIINFNKQLPKKDPRRILGRKNYIDILIQNVYDALNLENSILDMYLEEKSTDKGSKESISDELQIEEVEPRIEFHKTISFADFCYRNIPNEKIARVAQGLARGDSYRTIDDNNKDLKYNFIRETSKVLRQEGYEYRLAFLFEKWFALKLGVPEDELDKYVAGVERIPDLIWKGEIYSLKFRYDSLSNTLKFSQSKTLEHNFYPEYKEALRRKTHYNYGLLHPKWSQEPIVKKVDPLKDPDIIIVKRPLKSKLKMLDLER